MMMMMKKMCVWLLCLTNNNNNNNTSLLGFVLHRVGAHINDNSSGLDPILLNKLWLPSRSNYYLHVNQFNLSQIGSIWSRRSIIESTNVGFPNSSGKVFGSGVAHTDGGVPVQKHQRDRYANNVTPADHYRSLAYRAKAKY